MGISKNEDVGGGRSPQEGAESAYCSSRVLRKSVSFVLASLRGSTYRSVRLASSLAAALLNGLFEHPGKCFPVEPDMRTIEVSCARIVFPQPARVGFRSRDKG